MMQVVFDHYDMICKFIMLCKYDMQVYHVIQVCYVMICKSIMLCYASLPCHVMQVWYASLSYDMQVMLCKFDMQVCHMICKLCYASLGWSFCSCYHVMQAYLGFMNIKLQALC